MMRINIIGTGFVDMADGGGLSFKRQNPQFRFCDVSLGRSVEFSIPATSKNRMMLGFGDDPAQYGTMLRKSLPCQVVYDGGQFTATLNVTGFEGNAFKCALILDNAEWINAIQDRKLSDCVSSWMKGVVWDSGSYVFDADDPDIYTQLEGNVLINYENGLGSQPVNWQLIPSVNIFFFLQDILTNLGVPSFTLDIPKEYWLVMPTINGGDMDDVTFASTGTNNMTVTQLQTYFSVESITLKWATALFGGVYIGGGTVPAKGFKALQDLKVTFPASFPTGVFLVQYDNRLAGYKTIGGISSSGELDKHLNEASEDLRGATVELKKGSIYFFAPKPFWDAPSLPIGYNDTAHPINETVKAVRDSDLSIGETWYIRYNMPDMTVFEFLKSVCLAIGRELYVDAGGIKVAVGKYGDKKFKALDDVVSVDSVKRNVEQWGADTVLASAGFDSEDYVTEPITVSFSVDNAQLEGEKEWKSKFSEGNVGSQGVLVEDVQQSGADYKSKAKRCTIAYADGNYPYLQRIPVPDPVGYDDIAGEGTCVKVKLRKGEAELFRLAPDTTYIWRGMAYVWTDADWNAGVLTLTLQKVSERR